MDRRHKAQRLWVRAAVQILIEQGFTGLTVSQLARRLGATRPEFYLTFQDRNDFLAKVLGHWEMRSLTSLVKTSVPSLLPLASQVEKLLNIRPRLWSLDLAIRGWARSYQQAAMAVSRVDNARLQALTQLFEMLGHPQQVAAAHARLVFRYQIGRKLSCSEVSGHDHALMDDLSLLLPRPTLFRQPSGTSS